MRFLLFSDLHLDSTFAWARPAAARRRRHGIRASLERVVTLADELGADAILSAGDLYEHDHVTPDTAAFLRRTLADAGRPVFLAPGNHDPYTRDSVYATTSWPDNVHVFTQDRLIPVDLESGLRLWGAAHLKQAGTDGFLDGFRAEGQAVHLALFHGSEESALTFEGDRKHPHAPFRADRIPETGLVHAFVGHYHRPADEPWHTYPGNPDPLVFGETGERGAVLVEVADDGTVRRDRYTVAQSQTRDLTVDVTGVASSAGIRRRVDEAVAGLEGAARITLEGDLPPEVDLRTDDLAGCSTDVLEVVVRTGRLGVAYDLEQLAREETVRGQFVRSVQQAPDLDDEERRRVLVTGLRALDGRTDLEVA